MQKTWWWLQATAEVGEMSHIRPSQWTHSPSLLKSIKCVSKNLPNTSLWNLHLSLTHTFIDDSNIRSAPSAEISPFHSHGLSMRGRDRLREEGNQQLLNLLNWADWYSMLRTFKTICCSIYSSGSGILNMRRGLIDLIPANWLDSGEKIKALVNWNTPLK